MVGNIHRQSGRCKKGAGVERVDAIVSLKSIVILDEPTSGLCKGQMASTVKYLQKMKEEGKTVIVITHDYEFIKECKGVVYEFLNTI